MPIVAEKTWRIDGTVSDAELECLRLNCQSCSHHQEKDTRTKIPGRSFFARGPRPLRIYTIVTTISDRQETLLTLKYSDRIQFYGQVITGFSD